MRKAIKIIYLNFFLLIALIWATHPIEKAIERLTDKYKIQEQKKMCTRIAQQQDDYGNYVAHIWQSGCIYQSKIMLQSHAVGDVRRLAEIETIFKEQESLEFKAIQDHCSDVSSLYVRQSKIKELIIKDLIEHFECEKLDWSKE